MSIRAACWKPPSSAVRPSAWDPSETPTGSWQFDGTATDAPISIEGAEHDIGATASLAALSSDLDFNIGRPNAPKLWHRTGARTWIWMSAPPPFRMRRSHRPSGWAPRIWRLPDLEPVTMSEVGTKLDLARAYMDMGDPEGARNILEEVVSEGSVAQKQEAQRLIESLPRLILKTLATDCRRARVRRRAVRRLADPAGRRQQCAADG